MTMSPLASDLAGAFIDRHPGYDGWIGAFRFTDGIAWLIGSTLGGVSGGIAIDLSGSYTAWSALLITASTFAILPLALRPRTRTITRRPAVAK